MKTLVVYDSVYGNTKTIAQAIGDAIPGAVQVLHVDEVEAGDPETVDLFIVGSPTHGAFPTEAVQGLLGQVGAPAREGARVAAFDTRVRWLRLFGYAAPKMADALVEKGWVLAGEPGGFFVGSKKRGPLKPGEADRAAAWAKELAASLE